ncbi:MAG: penicillin-binding protein 1A [Proteobacteria bacterium]|nr:penicillin-binding protein 1A [Pseudomonadota bacterium]NCA28354.1 penicillin-binding protein 1A [Pseudomonadota bacterium]
MKKTISILFAGLIFMGVLGVSFAFIIFKQFSENLPDYEQLKNYNPMITTRLYASDGSLISEFSKEKRIFVPIDSIPKNLINAFLAAEDANFYKHSGIDLFAIFRTSITNTFGAISGEGGMGGASTITQQVVKNFLLTRERTFQRKIKEAILAYRMSKTFPKERILELYLNQIYLGSGAYGVAAAAQVYFDKSIDELTLEEVALLATLPKAPSKLDPRKNIQKAKDRRNWVIERMIAENFIEEKIGKIAMEQPIVLKTRVDQDLIRASFFSDSVKKELTNLYGSDNVFENGIVVRTTLDPKIQNIGINALEKGIEDYDKKHGYRGALGQIDIAGKWQEQLEKFDVKKLYKESWLKAVVLSVSKDLASIGIENGEIGSIEFASVKWAKKYKTIDSRGPVPKKINDVMNIGDVILVEKSTKDGTFNLRQIPEVNGGFVALDPHTGRVIAMSGGYVDQPNQFNRSTQALRQPGSTMKTFGYIAALENGFTPASVVMDEEISLNQGIGLPPYRPSNYSGEFYGLTTLRTGLEQSRNVTTVRMADMIGLDKVVEVVKRFGVNDNPKQIYSLVLGSTETTVMRLATAYGMMVNGGKKISPSMIEKIQDRDGKTIYKRDKRTCNNCFINNLNDYIEKAPEQLPTPILADDRETVTDSATAYQITSMLQGVVDRGTAGRAKSIGKIIGGKTGTTNNSFDSWFVGFSPDLVMAVYVGFDTPKSLGDEETGASVALPIFIDFMKEAMQDKPSIPFRVPNTVKLVKIDRTTGKYPTPSTPKEKIFFEALKVEDNLEETSSETSSSESSNKDSSAQEPENNLEENQPSGIY